MSLNDPEHRQSTERSAVTNEPKKKLIEVSLPLEAINRESIREKSIRQGHPSTMHLWWSRKPLATARAFLFAQLVDDPSSRSDEFPSIEAQDAERARLHDLIERLAVWENSNDVSLLEEAEAEIRRSNDGRLPQVLDPFAGGGSIPLEAQRLGLKAEASDLNPVAVLLNKAMIEFPPRFAHQTPVSPNSSGRTTEWLRAEGLAEDVRSYGKWMRDEAARRIGHLYPRVTAPGGTEHTVVAYKWVRTVQSPNPAHPIRTPLSNSWWLSKKKGREAYVVPSVVGNSVEYVVHHDAHGPSGASDGTVGRSKGGAVSLADGTPISWDYIRSEGQSGRIGHEMVAVVAEGTRTRLYLDATEADREIANVRRPVGVAEEEIPLGGPAARNVPLYGMTTFADLFTPRQLVAMETLSDLVGEAREAVFKDAVSAGMPPGERLEHGGSGAAAYADAVATYLALAVSRQTNRMTSLNTWQNIGDKVAQVFTRQVIPMTWDYAEVNPFSSSSGNFLSNVDWVAEAVNKLPASAQGTATQGNAAERSYEGRVISTDPPYYDMVGYSDLADFFYVWLRRSLSSIHSELLRTILTPKSDELVANPNRHGGKAGAEATFVRGFNSVFSKMRQSANNLPMTVYYAYKQQDSNSAGTTSTGWHTLLEGLTEAGWAVTATWPVQSERQGRTLSQGTNALASSIVLACRPRPVDAPATTRRAFVAALKSELPVALHALMQGTIAPVDLAQAAIGPGISVFSRYSRVREADGSDMSVKDALLLVNATLDEVIGEQESDFDPDTRFAVKWYRQYGWMQENSGIADQLARSSDTSIGALERGGIFEAKGGKARLLSPTQLENAWDVNADERVSVWEATVRLAAVMAKHGADQVAALLPSVQTRVNLEAVKELGFLLFHEAEKKRDTQDAILFNGLVSAWGDVNEQARKHAASPRAMQQAFDFDEDGD